MDARIFVARETDEAHLARLLGFQRRLEASFVEDPIRIVVVHHLVELPQVEMVGPEPAQAFVQVLQRPFVVALAVLRHQEYLVAAAVHAQRLAHHLFGVAVVIIPSVVEEVDALVHGRVHDADGFALVLHRSDMPAAQTYDRDALPGLAEYASGNPGRGRATGLGDYLFRQRGRGRRHGGIFHELSA